MVNNLLNCSLIDNVEAFYLNYPGKVALFVAFFAKRLICIVSRALLLLISSTHNFLTCRRRSARACLRRARASRRLTRSLAPTRSTFYVQRAFRHFIFLETHQTQYLICINRHDVALSGDCADARRSRAYANFPFAQFYSGLWLAIMFCEAKNLRTQSAIKYFFLAHKQRIVFCSKLLVAFAESWPRIGCAAKARPIDRPPRLFAL